MSALKPKAAQWEHYYFSRRKQLLRQIRGEAALIVASPHSIKSRDDHYPFFQDRNFYYLTGLHEDQSALLLLNTGKGPRSIFFVKDRDPAQERFEGERLGVKRARRRFNVDEVRDIASFEKDLSHLLANVPVLHFAAGVNPSVDHLIWKLYKSSLNPRLQFPHTIKDVRLILNEMRFVKDKQEIGLLRHAADITAHGILRFVEVLPRIKSEAHGARVIEQGFAELGASDIAFPTIVASGKNATTLHHRPGLQPLWKRSLVLVDAGASFRGYAGDVSRVFPTSGKFSTEQGEIYDVVYRALQVGIKRARPDVTLNSIHNTVVRELTSGLLQLRLLRGSLGDNIATQSYRKFFMHRTSHFLGLDVHDVAPFAIDRTGHLNSPYLRPLVPGCVITMEPGLYFDSRNSTIPYLYRGIGVRLEEDILITASGSEVLSHAIPTERKEVERLVTN